MKTLRVDRVPTIKSLNNYKKSPYGQKSKPQSKFDYMFKKELRRLKANVKDN